MVPTRIFDCEILVGAQDRLLAILYQFGESTPIVPLWFSEQHPLARIAWRSLNQKTLYIWRIGKSRFI
jgi:hypothetical protein